MDKRSLWGWIIVAAGVAVSPFVFPMGVIVFIVGLAIVLNKNEDKIEAIKGGKNNDK